MTATIDVELLISLIENRPVIWDKTLESYKDKNMRSAAWREVCIVLKNDFEGMEELKRQDYAKIVVKKWNQIRDSWMRSLTEKKNAKRTGFVKQYIYHKQLLFLKKIIKPSEIYESTNNATNETRDEINQDYTEELELATSINHNGQSEHESSIVNKSPKQEGGAKRIKSDKVARRKLNTMDQKMMAFIDHQTKKINNSQNEDRNLSFFRSLLPTVALFNDDEVLEFQAGVISLLQNIKSRSRNVYSSQPQSAFNYAHQPPQRYFASQYCPQQVHQPSLSPSTSIQSVSEFQLSPGESSD